MGMGEPRWLSFSLRDRIYCAYLALFGSTVAFVLGGLPTLAGSLSFAERILLSALSWPFFITIFQFCYSEGGFLRGLWGCFSFLVFRFPLTILSFFWYGREFWTHLKKLPWKMTFILSLVVTPLCGLAFSAPPSLPLILLMVFQSVVLHSLVLKWTLRPISVLKRFAISPGIKQKIVDGLAKVEENTKAKLAERIKGIQTVFSFATRSIARTFNAGNGLFLIVCACLFVAGFTNLVAASFLRYLNEAGSGALSGELFDGRATDYISIAVLQYTGSDLLGVDVTSRGVRTVLLLLPWSSYYLFGMVLLAFSTVTTSRIDKMAELALQEGSDLNKRALQTLVDSLDVSSPKSKAVREESSVTSS